MVQARLSQSMSRLNGITRHEETLDLTKGRYLMLKHMVLLAFIFSWAQTENLSAMTTFRGEHFYEYIYSVCPIQSISGSYQTGKSTYQIIGVCTDGVGSWSWTAQGAYRNQDGTVNESIALNGPGQSSGRVEIRLKCDADPWIDSSTCISPVSNAQGAILGAPDRLRDIQQTIEHYKKPLTAQMSPATRANLLAKRQADLKAEATAAAQAEADAKAAALARTNKRLQQGARQGPAVVVPTIQSPAPGALFFSNTLVPIKIAPPQGIAATGYLVRIESRNAQGAWTLVTNLPVGAAEASSPSGYLGWGAPGPGRGAAMIAGPGTYRVSAQVSTPRATVWSQSVQFVVTAHSKAIQKAPKLFGQ